MRSALAMIALSIGISAPALPLLDDCGGRLSRELDLNEHVRVAQQLWHRRDSHLRVEAVLSTKNPRVRADPRRLRHTLGNLILNAMQELGTISGVITLRTEGGVTLESSAEGVLGKIGPGRFVVLSVEDDGNGMTAENLARACRKAFTTKERGSGHGLISVRDFAGESNGDITVESVLGRGTIFRLYFPALD